MVELCGARLRARHDRRVPEPAARRAACTLRSARVEKLLGEQIADGESAAILERLGLRAGRPAEELEVACRYWRDADVQREADLIEEVARDPRARQAADHAARARARRSAG